MRKRKTMSLVMIFLSLVSIIIGTPLMALFAVKAWYVPMCLMIPILVHGFYGFGFYLIANRHNKTFIKLFSLIESGILSFEDLAREAKLNEKGLGYFLMKMEKKGYLKDYVISGGMIEKK